MTAEDIPRFAACTAEAYRESAGNVKKGHITKEGDPLVRKYIAGAAIKHSSTVRTAACRNPTSV